MASWRTRPSRLQKIRALERERRNLIERQNSRLEEIIIGTPARAGAVLTFAAALPTLIGSALIFASPGKMELTVWIIVPASIIFIAFLALLGFSYLAASKILGTLPPRPLELSLPPDNFSIVGTSMIGDDLDREVDSQMIEQAKFNLIANNKTLEELRRDYYSSIGFIKSSMISAMVILLFGVIMKEEIAYGTGSGPTETATRPARTNRSGDFGNRSNGGRQHTANPQRPNQARS